LRCLLVGEAWSDLKVVFAERNDGSDVLGTTHQNDILASQGSFDQLVEMRLRFLDRHGSHGNMVTLSGDLRKGLLLRERSRSSRAAKTARQYAPAAQAGRNKDCEERWRCALETGSVAAPGGAEHDG